MKRILVPTDFSHVAQNALNYAIEIASKVECELLLYHAYESNKKTGYKWSSSKEGNHQIKNLEEQMSSLEEKYEKILTNRGVLLQTKVEEQPVSSLFERIVEKYDIDLIIMGSKGASGLKKMIFGSVAARALDEAKAPVIVVPPHKHYLPIEQAVLAIDFDHVYLKALAPFKELSSKTGVNISILNINSGKTNEESLQSIKDYLKDMDTTYNQVPVNKNINQSINDTIASNKYELLCMIRRKKGFWESLFQKSFTNAQVEKTPIPLMVLPEK